MSTPVDCLVPLRRAAVVVRARAITPLVHAPLPPPEPPPDPLPHYACPHCSGPVVRVRRRWNDRLLSVLVLMPLRRFGCRSPACGWFGNLHHWRFMGRMWAPLPRIYDGRSEVI